MASFLARAVSALEAFGATPEHRQAMPVLCRFSDQAAEELKALQDDPGRPAAALEAVLAPLDQEMARLVLLESDRDLVEGWKTAARARLGDLADTMEPRALAATVERLARQAALSHWGLPRLSLLYMEG